MAIFADVEVSCILLIEDNEIDRRSISRAISQAGWQDLNILEATTGSQGLEIARSTDVDCIILDHKLPDMWGLEVLDELTRGKLVNSLPVLMLTGMEDVTLASEALKLGAQDFLVKEHINSVSLLRSIRNTIEKAQMYRQLADSVSLSLDPTTFHNIIELIDKPVLVHDTGKGLCCNGAFRKLASITEEDDGDLSTIVGNSEIDIADLDARLNAINHCVQHDLVLRLSSDDTRALSCTSCRIRWHGQPAFFSIGCAVPTGEANAD